MIDNQGKEVNRSQCINSLVRTRDIDGNPINVPIHEHRGSLIRLKDSKGFQYLLPIDIKLKVLDDGANYENIEDDSNIQSAPARLMSLLEIFNEFENETVIVEDYQGGAIEIILEEILENQRYGWPSPSDFAFIENNLIINSPELNQIMGFDPAHQDNKIPTEEELLEDGYWLQSDGGSEHFMPNDFPRDGG